ncbi:MULTISPECIES: GUN4 domain-containing protein [unclassified Okeania]|uniref:GUN4 domain-containing protein n=1 Tax=unclassified Okeania TaxID=2634635 RepID=UPI0013C006BC|nr:MULTISPECIES: GUN4 domain-containing protein [unclassified Okeania]NEN92849.1 GUN4 domain-containing protein [Okeania sp. SIO3H1]NET27311.1 GUN4 domain-containing protein [Okeania sp. SIO1I7]NET41163.1 GUN4 domain-containing protein [Okeania sp. SIO2B3]
MSNEIEYKEINTSTISSDESFSSQQNSRELELSERVAQLEKKLDEALMLISDIYRYGKLRDLLSAGKWKEADQETAKVMLEISGQTDKEKLTPDDVIKFPCSVINLIDELWMNYSKGHFGFSIQKKIYESMGGTYDISQIDMKVLNMTCERLGLLSNNKSIPYEKLNFSLEAPKGCFPVAWWDSPYGAKLAVYFLARLNACNID